MAYEDNTGNINPACLAAMGKADGRVTGYHGCNPQGPGVLLHMFEGMMMVIKYGIIKYIVIKHDYIIGRTLTCLRE